MKFNINKKLFLLFPIITLLLALSSQKASAAFSCDSGTVDTTCNVTANKTLGNGENITGTGTIVLSNNAQIIGYAGSAATITIANLTINSGSYINFDGKGLTGGLGGIPNGNATDGNISGAGGGTGYGGGGGGGGHGGVGGNGYTTTAGGIEHDQVSIHQPTALGSGGGGGGAPGGGWQYSGGAGGSGGGAIKLNISGTLTLNSGGYITANGNNGSVAGGQYAGDGGGGSGGSIWIQSGTITGSGTVRANGGNGNTAGYDGGGGAGGRVAITYTTDSSSNYTKTTYGGSGYAYGASGSIYTKQDSATYGDITFNNNSQNSPTRTITSTYGVQNFQNFTFSEGTAGFTINSGVVLNIYGTLSNFGGAFTNNGTFNANSDTSITFTGAYTNTGPFSASSLTFLTFSNTFNNSTNSTFDLGSITTLTFPNTFANTGTITFPSSLTTLTFSSTNNNTGTITANSLTTLNVNGASTNSGTFSATTLDNLNIGASMTVNPDRYSFPTDLAITINNGGTLTHTANTTARTYYLDFTLSNLTINSGGYINADGKGLTGGLGGIPNGNATDGNISGAGGGTGYGGGGGGGGHGGVGGNGYTTTAGGIEHDQVSIHQPTALGSGGGGGGAPGGGWQYSGGAGGSGGGAIKLNISGTLTLNSGGYITANGNNGSVAGGQYAGDGGGGSGGSIWIQSGTITGSGTVRANGGNGNTAGYDGGGGAGGRVALHFTKASGYNLTNTATGGTGYASGGNGSIYYNVSGTYTSSVIDFSNPINFSTLTYNKTTTADSISTPSLTVDARAGNTDTPDGSWTSWSTNIASGGSLNAFDNYRYIQYRLNLSSNNAIQSPKPYDKPTANPSLQDVSVNYTAYLDKTLTSSIYNSNDGANTLGSFAWDETINANTNIRFQMQTSANGTDWSGYMGPDGEADTYFDDANSEYCSKVGNTVTCDIDETGALGDHTNDQYFQYKAYLISEDGTATPTLSSVTVTYVVNANPELEVIPTAVFNSSSDVDITYSVRDKDSETNLVTPSFEYSLNGGSSWTAITAGCLEAEDLEDKAVAEPAVPPEDTLYTSHTATWNPSCEIGQPGSLITTSTYEEDAKIRVKVNDGQAANNYNTLDADHSDSVVFILDTKAPIPNPANPILVNASVSPAELTLSASDDSTFYQILASGADQTECETNLSSEIYTDEYNTSPTLELSDDPAIICVQFQDQYENESAISYLTTPETPQGFMIQDTSNMLADPNEFRLFVAWQVVEVTSPAFSQYEIYRSEQENTGYTELTTIDDINLNYYGDAPLAEDDEYYYKVRQLDEDGNYSFFTAPLHAKANGIEDYGEGGGGTSDAEPVIDSESVDITDIFTTQALITWDTDKISNSTVEYITEIGGNFTDAPSQGVASMRQDETVLGIHQVTLSNLTPNTTYYLKLKSTDPYGNTGESQDGVNGYTFTTLDGPNITAVNNRNRTSDSVEIVWTTDIASDSYVTYDDNDSFSSPTTIGSDDEVTSHIVEITGLNPETPYYFYVESDVAKDDNQGNYYTFTTLAEEQEEEPEDEEGPTISNVEVSDITYNSATVSWETDGNSNSLVDYGETDSYGNTQGDRIASLTTHEVLLSGLNSLTTYYYQVSSYDSNNNVSTDDNSGSGYTFTTLAPTEDTDDDGEGDQLTDIMEQIQEMIDQYFFSAQEIQDALAGLYSISISSSGPSVDVTDNIATISWTTNREAIGKVYYWQDTDNEDTARSENENITVATTDHEIILKDLNADTKYNYYVESIGLLNESIASDTSSFSTEDIPQISGISIENVTLNSADISWSTTDSVDSSVLEYGEDISYGSEEEGETSSSLHTVNLTNLKTNTTYHLRVSGEDADGQTITSNDYSFTTVSLPTITNVKVKDITTETAVITWSTNVKTDSRVEFKRENQDKGTTQGNLEAVTDHTFTLTNLYPGSKYTFKVSSKDALNNESSSEENSFTTNEDLNPPVITNVKSDTTVFPGKEAQIQTIISWNTDKNATSVLAYREGVQKDPSLDEQLKNKDIQKIENWKLAKKNELTKNHLFVLTDLKPASLYQFKVVSFDKHDNLAISENFSLLTPTKQQSVLDLIIENFETTFGWVKKIGN